MRRFAKEFLPALTASLESGEVCGQIERLQEQEKEREENSLRHLEQTAVEHGVVLLPAPRGFVFVPAKDGEPLDADERAKLSTEEQQAFDRLADEYRDEFPEADDADVDSASPIQRYQVNLLIDRSATHTAPIVVEESPTYQNLVGRFDQIAHLGTLVTNFNLIKAGALHNANGGYLLLDALKVLSQPLAWEGLKRALKLGHISDGGIPAAKDWGCEKAG